MVNINILLLENPSENEDPDKPYFEKMLRLLSQQKREREKKWQNLKTLGEIERQFEENNRESGFGGNDGDPEDNFLGQGYDETRGLDEHFGHTGNQDWEENEDNEENDTDLENDDNNLIEKRKNYDLQNKDVNGNLDEDEEEEEEEEKKREESNENDEEDEENDEENIDDEEHNDDQEEDENDKKRNYRGRAKSDLLSFWMRELKKFDGIKTEETRCGGNCLE